jgi:hypothetical protein
LVILNQTKILTVLIQNNLISGDLYYDIMKSRQSANMASSPPKNVPFKRNSDLGIMDGNQSIAKVKLPPFSGLHDKPLGNEKSASCLCGVEVA